jgi:hypothetical protein
MITSKNQDTISNLPLLIRKKENNKKKHQEEKPTGK